jgi:hypothetical protein
MLSLDDRKLERIDAALIGRLDLRMGRTSLTVDEVTVGMNKNVFANIRNWSHSITAAYEILKGRANGVISSELG